METKVDDQHLSDPEDTKKDALEFNSPGEYVSLKQARIMAVAVAQEPPGNYGRAYNDVHMASDLIEQEKGEDYYVITLSFRPEGDFVGEPSR